MEIFKCFIILLQVIPRKPQNLSPVDILNSFNSLNLRDENTTTRIWNDIWALTTFHRKYIKIIIIKIVPSYFDLVHSTFSFFLICSNFPLKIIANIPFNNNNCHSNQNKSNGHMILIQSHDQWISHVSVTWSINVTWFMNITCYCHMFYECHMLLSHVLWFVFVSSWFIPIHFLTFSPLYLFLMFFFHISFCYIKTQWLK